MKNWTRRARMLAYLILAMLSIAISIDGQAKAHETACDSPAFQTVLHAEPGKQDARAFWLDRTHIRWPGEAGDGHFRLYHAHFATMQAIIGQRVQAADGAIDLQRYASALDDETQKTFAYAGTGPTFEIPSTASQQIPMLLREQTMLVREDDEGRVLDATRLQMAGVLDALYAEHAGHVLLGAQVGKGRTRFTLWAPTARSVTLCTYATSEGKAVSAQPLHFDVNTGGWKTAISKDLRGQYYLYLVEVWVPGSGIVRNRVTDPYSVSLNADSRRSYVANLDDARLKPAGWATHPRPAPLASATDMSVYELHVRDFSISDETVPQGKRGKYLAFTETGSAGMRHLQALAKAGLTDIHLLPVFDFATVPERQCVTPRIDGIPNGRTQQAAITKHVFDDCYNWGYDPWHYNAPEGSYASDANDGAKRILELRQLVQSLHAMGLRVGMDVVYNHTFAAGQLEHSVLDRIVPGYYQRLNGKGEVEHSTCCSNTATEHAMMGKLLVDSVELWATAYQMDSFRFDLMGHQPRAVMERLQQRLRERTGRTIQLIGEGWNFGEIANGARFVQAAQGALNGSGIGTFNDRLRDALRGGGAGEGGTDFLRRQGYINGLFYAPNEYNLAHPEQAPRQTELLAAVDLVKSGLAGSLRNYPLTTHDGQQHFLHEIDYNGQPAGYASEPAEVVNYVGNHDNQTLFDINAFKLPRNTSAAERVRVQMLGLATVALSQGIAYFHAGEDILRSKSMDKNSFESGDWFNRIDWQYRDNHFGSGLPPERDNGSEYVLLEPLLADASIKPAPHDIALARDIFRDLLAIRASSTLFRMRSAADINQRLHFFQTGTPTLTAMHLDGHGYPGANFRSVLVIINVAPITQPLTLPAQAGHPWHLHPAQANGADDRARQTVYREQAGAFEIPARDVVVFVED